MSVAGVFHVDPDFVLEGLEDVFDQMANRAPLGANPSGKTLDYIYEDWGHWELLRLFWHN